MDKQKIIHAYRKGFLSERECMKMLGMNPPQMLKMMQGADSKESGGANQSAGS